MQPDKKANPFKRIDFSESYTQPAKKSSELRSPSPLMIPGQRYGTGLSFASANTVNAEKLDPLAPVMPSYLKRNPSLETPRTEEPAVREAVQQPAAAEPAQSSIMKTPTWQSPSFAAKPPEQTENITASPFATPETTEFSGAFAFPSFMGAEAEEESPSLPATEAAEPEREKTQFEGFSHPTFSFSAEGEAFAQPEAEEEPPPLQQMEPPAPQAEATVVQTEDEDYVFQPLSEAAPRRRSGRRRAQEQPAEEKAENAQPAQEMPVMQQEQPAENVKPEKTPEERAAARRKSFLGFFASEEDYEPPDDSYVIPSMFEESPLPGAYAADNRMDGEDSYFADSYELNTAQPAYGDYSGYQPQDYAQSGYDAQQPYNDYSGYQQPMQGFAQGGFDAGGSSFGDYTGYLPQDYGQNGYGAQQPSYGDYTGYQPQDYSQTGYGTGQSFYGDDPGYQQPQDYTQSGYGTEPSYYGGAAYPSSEEYVPGGIAFPQNAAGEYENPVYGQEYLPMGNESLPFYSLMQPGAWNQPADAQSGSALEDDGYSGYDAAANAGLPEDYVPATVVPEAAAEALQHTIRQEQPPVQDPQDDLYRQYRHTADGVQESVRRQGEEAAPKAAYDPQSRAEQKKPVNIRGFCITLAVVVVVAAALALTVFVVRVLNNIMAGETSSAEYKQGFYQANKVSVDDVAARMEPSSGGEQSVPVQSVTAAPPTASPIPDSAVAAAAPSAGEETSTDPAQQGSTTRSLVTRYPNNPLCLEDPTITELQKKSENPNVVGKLTIPDLLDEVVIKAEGLTYLTHDYKGSSSEGGAVGMVNTEDLKKKIPENIILRASDSTQGKGFYSLRAFAEGDASFVVTHPTLRLVTTYEDAEYVLFAVVPVSTKENSPDYFSLAGKTRFKTDEEMLQFVQEAKRRSKYDLSVEILPSDRLLTLATVSTNSDDEGLILFYRMLRSGEAVIVNQ